MRKEFQFGDVLVVLDKKQSGDVTLVVENSEYSMPEILVSKSVAQDMVKVLS